MMQPNWFVRASIWFICLLVLWCFVYVRLRCSLAMLFLACCTVLLWFAPTQATHTLSKVNIVMILVDDLGHGGIESNNPYVLGPRVTELQHEGLYLSRHYVYKFCSPTRGSFLSGRYPYRLGNTRSNFIPWSRPDGLNTNFETLPLRLKSRGYSTHHVVGARLSASVSERALFASTYGTSVPVNLCVRAAGVQ